MRAQRHPPQHIQGRDGEPGLLGQDQPDKKRYGYRGDAAAKNVKDVLSVTLRDKLTNILAKDKMIPRDKIVFSSLPADKIVFSQVLKELGVKKKGDRYPIFDAGGKKVEYIIHKSKIDEYLAEQALKGTSQSDLQKRTLKDILDNPDDNKKYGELFKSSIAVVGESATLLDAKTRMEETSDCQDVFITKGGTKNDEVVGWITNVIITANSKV